ncbi:hypothetical protein H696_06015 [Fonticula alba]|uniref:C2 NT-type domain-containing protein n=1 Tax=Fonticula alba TaxID=691883 RepID=A0A058YZV4_FONAL|nr:hypothetical protein H696_06015 [Fonticula alba]KCV67495.1 hypothetical protein H696_06015 [Fonticula alba]|eukprot:XP_009498056.1 hypothetical protein H696_06015 [Fonticula alba]
MLRRRARRIGKKAEKYKFSLTVQYADLQFQSGWTPPPLVIQWSRSGRQATTDASAVHAPMSPGNMRVTWDQPLVMVSTLYKEAGSALYEVKDYAIRLCEARGDKAGRLLAQTHLNLAEYASKTPQYTHVTLALTTHAEEAAAQKGKSGLAAEIHRAIVGVTIGCEAIAEGDSISAFDSMSDVSSIHHVDHGFDSDDDHSSHMGSLATFNQNSSGGGGGGGGSLTRSPFSAQSLPPAPHQLLAEKYDVATDQMSADQLRTLYAEARLKYQEQMIILETDLFQVEKELAKTRVRQADAAFELESQRHLLRKVLTPPPR